MPRRKKTNRRKRKVQRGGNIPDNHYNIMQNSTDLRSPNTTESALLPNKSKKGGREKAIKNIKKITSKVSAFTSSLGFEGMLLYCTFITAIVMFIVAIITPNEKPSKKDFPALLMTYCILLLCSFLTFGIYGRKIMKNAGQNSIYTFFKIVLPVLSAVASLSYIIFLNAKWKLQLAHVIKYMPEMSSFNILIACISFIQVYKIIEYFRKKSNIVGDFNVGIFNIATFGLLFFTSFGLTTVIFTKIQAYITDG